MNEFFLIILILSKIDNIFFIASLAPFQNESEFRVLGTQQAAQKFFWNNADPTSSAATDLHHRKPLKVRAKELVHGSLVTEINAFPTKAPSQIYKVSI